MKVLILGAGQVGESGTWTDDSRMMFWVGNTTPTVSNPALTILRDGKVGIGTTAPANKLHVSYVMDTGTTPVGLLQLEGTDTGSSARASQ